MKIAERFTGTKKVAARPKRKVTCPRYEPLPGARRCQHYLDDGACALPDEFMCVEWLKMHGHPVPPPRTKRPQPSQQPAVEATQESAQLIRTLSDEEIASFRELGLEVRLATDEGEVWLVPEYSHQEGRRELRFDHAVTLAVVCAAFPGARVMSLDFEPLKEGESA